MAKITAQNLIDMGFTGEMFGPEADALEGFFEDVIDEQAADLAVRLGDIYASADADTARAVRTAEKALCAAELVRRRIVQAMSLAVPNNPPSKICKRCAASFSTKRKSGSTVSASIP